MAGRPTERIAARMNPDQSDMTARTVGRYELLSQLGHGGMATVYLARQPGLDRDVALKELHRFEAADQHVSSSRFLREARLAGSLQHQNIVTVLEYFEHDQRAYIAMEYLEGGSLRDYLPDLPLPQAMGVLEGLLAALAHAHSRDVVHRDIKPENILVTAEGHVKLTDFGIARAYNVTRSDSVLTAHGTTIGTPKYMAPEQGTGGEIGPAADLYSAGIVAYELLVGRVPFDAEDTPLAIVWQHVNDPLPDPRLARPGLDARLCRWLEELLAKKAADRPPNALAALEALEEITVDMLGVHWRREARLSAPRVTRATARPLTPPPLEQLPPDATAPPGVRVDEGAQGNTIAPRAQRGHTELFSPEGRRRRRAAESEEQPVVRRRRRLIAIAAAVALIAGAALGVALFAGDDPAPAPPAVATGPSPAARAAAADRQRYVAALTTIVQRLGRARDPVLARYRAARTSAGQARIATLIGATYRDAAAELSRVKAAPSQADRAALVRAQLRRTARQYGDLADAAKAHRAARYRATARAIARGEKRLNRLVAGIPA
jgi:tRNA A-37 threonylcarbamoyl transferase component Bud32